jgi:energy-coupling factor transporter ATP-binding protein EcfA2
MNSSPHPGLRRIIVMQSSNIDYANLALADSTQLVGGNGRGKTTLINVLQFLYVPNETSWFFNGHRPPATKEHYFPRDKQPYARVIFEVMTPKGPAIVGVRRKTVASTDLEHFFAIGAFERADFYDEDNRCKPWDKVKDALIVKGFKVIPDLQASLTGGSEINLGLVPMRKGDGRELFDVKFIIPFPAERIRSKSHAASAHRLCTPHTGTKFV